MTWSNAPGNIENLLLFPILSRIGLLRDNSLNGKKVLFNAMAPTVVSFTFSPILFIILDDSPMYSDESGLLVSLTYILIVVPLILLIRGILIMSKFTLLSK